jgi:hypothetical protein
LFIFFQAKRRPERYKAGFQAHDLGDCGVILPPDSDRIDFWGRFYETISARIYG